MNRHTEKKLKSERGTCGGLEQVVLKEGGGEGGKRGGTV